MRICGLRFCRYFCLAGAHSAPYLLNLPAPIFQCVLRVCTASAIIWLRNLPDSGLQGANGIND